jgi:hypothetical protein
MHRYLIVDGMISGTGIRGEYEGEYIDPKLLKISLELIGKLNNWHERYKQEFYNNYADETKVQQLDKEGVEISRDVSNEIENCKVSYFSDADLRTQKI